MTRPATIQVDEIEASALVFSIGPCVPGANEPARYVVTAEHMDTLAFWAKFGHDAKQIAGMYQDSSVWRGWFAFWVADCFDPPIYIIRGDSWESAYEAFCDEYSRLIAIDDASMADYDPETVNYSASGVAIDTDNVGGTEIRLLRVEVAQ